jgi:hypothetical protein
MSHVTGHFRNLVDRLDGAVFQKLHDEASIDGRPVRGMFATPWLDPQVEQLKTGIVEPTLTVRDVDACGLSRGAFVQVCCREYEVVAIEPDGTGVTVLVLREKVA